MSDSLEDLTMLTRTEVAEVLKIGISTLRRWEAEGTAPPRCVVGKQTLYPKVWFEGWIEDRAKVPA